MEWKTNEVHLEFVFSKETPLLYWRTRPRLKRSAAFDQDLNNSINHPSCRSTRGLVFFWCTMTSNFVVDVRLDETDEVRLSIFCL